jgi:hypothetical protein
VLAPQCSAERSGDTVEPITFMEDLLAQVRVLFAQLGVSVHAQRIPIPPQNVHGVGGLEAPYVQEGSGPSRYLVRRCCGELPFLDFKIYGLTDVQSAVAEVKAEGLINSTGRVSAGSCGFSADCGRQNHVPKGVF